jgi:hypothetical protein
MSRKRILAVSLAVAVAACGGEMQVGGGASSPSAATSAAAVMSEPVAVPVTPPLAPSTSPQVELREPGAAIVGGQRVVFDGVVEAFAWPSLTKALGRKAGDTSPVVVQVGRDVPIINLLRAAWTLRTADVRVQSLDEKGVLYAVELKAKPAAPAPPKACHLAVFLLPTGALRIAAPAGPQEVGGDRPAESLANALKATRTECPTIKYVAFGAETNDVPWGRVFDVMVAVDRVKAAGGARYILGEAIHAVPTPAASAKP